MLNAIAVECISSPIGRHCTKKVRALLIGHLVEAFWSRAVAKNYNCHHPAIAAVSDETTRVFSVCVFRFARFQNYSLRANQTIGTHDVIVDGTSQTRKNDKCGNQRKPKPNPRISMMPIQNVGADCPIKAKDITIWS